MIDNVIPLAHKAEQKGGGGFKNNFPPHTESALHHLSPEYLLLKGVRQDHNKEAQTCRKKMNRYYGKIFLS